MDELNAPSFLDQSPQQPSILEKRIGFGRRLGALLLDSALALIVAVILYFLVGDQIREFADAAFNARLEEQGQSLDSMPGQIGSMMSSLMTFGMLSSLAGIAISFVELFMGASVGKMLLNMQVAYADGRRAGIGLWAQRWAAKHLYTLLSTYVMFYPNKALNVVSSLVGFAYLIGCLFVLGAQRQGFHDMIVKSAVFMNEDIES